MGEPPTGAKPDTHAVRGWFLRPPRPHGEQLEDRSVGFLELFYDLVFVVLVSRLAAALAEHVSARGALDYGVLFSLAWVSWFNGSLYHDLRGREDGRARSLMFLQMGLLALLAVYAGWAGGDDGMQFGWVLTALLFAQTYQWYTVYRIDEPTYRRFAARYGLARRPLRRQIALPLALPPTRTDTSRPLAIGLAPSADGDREIVSLQRLGAALRHRAQRRPTATSVPAVTHVVASPAPTGSTSTVPSCVVKTVTFATAS